jgi:outer membrane lipoprotein SlyB
MTKNGKVQAMKKTMLALAAASSLVVPMAPVEARHHYRHATTHHYYTTSNGVRYWRGSGGRYYCHRKNGTVGLLVGGAAGALLGRAVDGGRNHTTGTVIGAAAGALLGRSVARNSGRGAYCR